MEHDVEHPWGVGEQLVGWSPGDIFRRIAEKMVRTNPAKNPGSFAAPESTLNRQIPSSGATGDIGGRPGGHAGYGR
jgi:hypothetical protein